MQSSFCVSLLAVLAIFVAEARPVTVEIVPVSNAGNANDPATGSRFGAVDYDYCIGKYEVTVGQYAEFLNAVAATDTYELYDKQMTINANSGGISRTGSTGSYRYSVIGSAQKPITHLTWGDAARFCNWLHNGQAKGLQRADTTEDGAYSLNGVTTRDALNAIKRNVGARWFIPSENEWYKAAYYHPRERGGDADDYWAFPTRRNDKPHSAKPPGTDAPMQANTANFKETDYIANGYDDGYAVTGSSDFTVTKNLLTDAGAYSKASSFYGTFDQGGNVFEWTEAVVHGRNRIARGGSWISDSIQMSSSYRDDTSPPTEQYGNMGFRVASIPSYR